MINMDQSKHNLYKWESGGNDEAPDLDSIRHVGPLFFFLQLLHCWLWTLSLSVPVSSPPMPFLCICEPLGKQILLVFYKPDIPWLGWTWMLVKGKGKWEYSKQGRTGWTSKGRRKGDDQQKYEYSSVSYHIPAHGLYMCSFLCLCRMAKAHSCHRIQSPNAFIALWWWCASF